MSRSSNFTVPDESKLAVPDESKLVGVTNYKQWAEMMVIQLKQFYCDLDMVLAGRFDEIPDVVLLEPRDKARIFSLYNTIIGNLMRIALPSNLVHHYVSEKQLYGLNIWTRLFEDYGQMTAQEEADMLLELLIELFTLNVSLTEKMKVLETANSDVLPLTEAKRIWCFYAVCDAALREKLLQVYKDDPSRFTWLTVKKQLGTVIAKASSAIEPAVAGAVLALLKVPPRKIMIQSKLVCFKCGGIGHKSNVCPSVSDADYRKPRHTTGRGSSGLDDEFRTQNRPSVA